MSVNITVNGKFRTHRRLLDDPAKVKKDEEQERRKLRLLEVREESKKLAKKIRDEVNEEKKRELQKLQETKEKELECWRQHALNRAGEEYRSAIFQMGTAHNAARRENVKKAEKQQQQQQKTTYKEFKKQSAARRANKNKAQAPCPCLNKEFKCICVQTDIPEYPERNAAKPQKRKRNCSFSSSDSEHEEEDDKEQNTLPQSTSSSFSSTTSTDSTISALQVNNRATQTSMCEPPPNKCLVKTPAVFVDVEVGSQDSFSISAPIEINDKHAAYNRQFTNIIMVSPPRKGRKQCENFNKNPSIEQSTTTTTATTTTTQSSDVTVLPSEEPIQKSPPKKKNEATKHASQKEKRFTIVSDLVKKQQQQQQQDRSTKTTKDPKYTPPACPPGSRATTTTTTTPPLSPRKQVKPPCRSPRRSSALSKSSKTITDNSQPTATLSTTKTHAVAPSTTSSSGRVQFFNYKTKLCKERDQAAANVTVQRQSRETVKQTAMEQAVLENQREKERQLESLKKSQQMEERSQKALEREQIRRDCNELTEKLDALTREYPNQGPTNENQLHIFADKKLRMEGKMNSAVEKLLDRPAIITCNEVNKENKMETIPTAPVQNQSNTRNEINLGAIHQKSLPADDLSSDSCCSILLGYVDDQSKLLKQDLLNSNTDGNENDSKQKRLKTLLQRLDELRSSLLEELKNESECKTKKQGENLKHVVNSISEMRKEREQILNNERAKICCHKKKEKELKAKEAILEKKVREFFELQTQQKPEKNVNRNKNKENENEKNSSPTNKNTQKQVISNDKEKVIRSAGEKPVEIVITLREENKKVRILSKPKRRITTRKSPSKVSTLIKSPQAKLAAAKRHTPKKKSQPTTAQREEILKRQSSYDSNSTSYMSLDSQLNTQLNKLAERIIKEKQNPDSSPKVTSTQELNKPESKDSVDSSNDVLNIKRPPRLNPLIAQYVQRLLGMSRNAVSKLSVSSSDIETPGSSIINTPSNVSQHNTMLSDESLIHIQNFMEENKSFIKELERSIRSQNKDALETSVKMFDDIWRKCLSECINQETSKAKDTTEKAKKSKVSTDSTTKDKTTTKDMQNQNKPKPHSQQRPKRSVADNEPKDNGKSLSSTSSTDNKDNSKSPKEHTVKRVDKAVETKNSGELDQDNPQIARYAKLTENCTNRIAELTELINKVREEKQRLLEVTLSSVSENGRHSTEYLDLPEGKSDTRNGQEDHTKVSSTSSENTTENIQSHSTDTLNDAPKLTADDKNQQITASRDSGIAESRPVTALENRIDQDPTSQTSSEGAVTQGGKKLKPPPTLLRFSPQLPEEEVAHELSTIFEVDTPATSRINTAAGQTINECETASNNGDPQQPIKFPTFEEYLKLLDLNTTQLDPEQNTQLQQEFNSFLECLQKCASKDAPKYTEFPCASKYVEKTPDIDELSETMEEMLAQLCVGNVLPENFPALREYIKGNASKTSSDEQQLLDTESLENISSPGNSENETVSLDIEEELKRRKILKSSFRYMKQKKKIFSSTANKDDCFYKEILATESGLDKLSSSANTADRLEIDMEKIKLQATKKKPHTKQQVQLLSSSTNTANTSTLANSAMEAASLDDESSKDKGKSLNLRDFLTRELLKRVNLSGSSSSSDESLRSHFFLSILGSLTPRTPGVASKSNAPTIERQKTSTPVPTPHSNNSSCANKSSPSHLFSGESIISSVRFVNSDSGNGDHSSES